MGSSRDDHLLLLQGEQLRRTSRPILHPKYQQGSGPILPRRTDEHDLMLLKLGRPVVPGPRVRPLRLPFRCTQPGNQCQIAGWATTSSRRGKSQGPWGVLNLGEGGSGAGTPGQRRGWESGAWEGHGLCVGTPGAWGIGAPGLPDAFSHQ